ncbi:hypothetical protein GCM10011408_11820 [Dyella caseinilytica]|nr:hypothetical protein GCM10011408_11820 [Dyella caseinilytica]
MMARRKIAVWNSWSNNSADSSGGQTASPPAMTILIQLAARGNELKPQARGTATLSLGCDIAYLCRLCGAEVTTLTSDPQKKGLT